MADISPISTNLSSARERQNLTTSSQYSHPPSWTPRSTGSTIELTEHARETTDVSRQENIEVASDESLALNQEAGGESSEKDTSRPWTPGVFANLPWGFMLVLFGTVAWFGGCIGVIFAADKTKTDSWVIAPTVILAILGPLGSMMLQYALSCGLVITWWKSALSGTTLGILHRQWDHGTSTWAAITSGKTMDKIALAKFMVMSVFAVNPLLQRALTTSLRTEREDVRLSTAAATDVQSLQDMNFTDAYRDSFYDPVQLSPAMTRIVQQFTDREPITEATSGCTGNCSGTLVAAGIDFQCNTVRNTSFAANFRNGAGGTTQVFKTGTNVMNYHTGADFNLTVFYAETEINDDDDSEYDTMKSCHGVSTTVNCVLQHAVVAYPFSQRDGVITPETQSSRIRILSTEPALVSSDMPPDRDPIFGGLSIAADSMFNSSGTVQTMGKYGSGFRTSGPLTAPYLVRGADARTCAVAFRDPTENIMSKLNEIMFRVALAAPNVSSPRTEFDAQQQSVFIIYESRYGYLWGALAITVLAAVAVTRTASGFHNLGRPFSLSPIEIAAAFGSQILRKPGTSNMDIEELMSIYENARVEYRSIDSSGARDAAGDHRNRLQFALPGQGTKPRARESFTG